MPRSALSPETWPHGCPHRRAGRCGTVRDGAGRCGTVRAGQPGAAAAGTTARLSRVRVASPEQPAPSLSLAGPALGQRTRSTRATAGEGGQGPRPGSGRAEAAGPALRSPGRTRTQRPYLGDVVHALLEGVQDDLLQHCHGLLAGREGAGEQGLLRACGGTWRRHCRAGGGGTRAGTFWNRRDFKPPPDAS